MTLAMACLAHRVHLPRASAHRRSLLARSGAGWIHPDAEVDPSAHVSPGAVVCDGAVVGAHVHVGPGSVVGAHARIGRGTQLRFNVSVDHCTIGEGCLLHHGVCVGQDGFGFYVDERGNVVKKPQELRVVIGNDVEIGANSCVDRGSWRDTVIGDHCKLDNLVQVGHNAVLGKACILCGQTALGGSSTLGDYVVMGGKSAVADHIKVVSKVRLAAKTGVIKDITTPGDYAGFPALPAQEWRKMQVRIKQLHKKKSPHQEHTYGH